MPVAMRLIAMLVAATLAGGALAQTSVPGSAILESGDDADGRWHWLSVEPARGDPSGWAVDSGVAAVTIDGPNFHAILQRAPDQPGADITLDGRITGDRVRATEVLLNTDAGPATVDGTLRRTPLGDMLEERIAFRGGQSGDASFLGLVRRVRRQ